jgi:hypothetical protein
MNSGLAGGLIDKINLLNSEPASLKTSEDLHFILNSLKKKLLSVNAYVIADITCGGKLKVISLRTPSGTATSPGFIQAAALRYNTSILENSVRFA